MFEHYLLTRSIGALRNITVSNRHVLTWELQYDVGLACVSRLNRVTRKLGIDLASDGCCMLDSSRGRSGEDFILRVLFKISCIVGGHQSDYIDVLASTEFFAGSSRQIRLSIGVRSRNKRFDLRKQSEAARRFQSLNDLQDGQPQWYLVEMLHENDEEAET